MILPINVYFIPVVFITATICFVGAQYSYLGVIIGSMISQPLARPIFLFFMAIFDNPALLKEIPRGLFVFPPDVHKRLTGLTCMASIVGSLLGSGSFSYGIAMTIVMLTMFLISILRIILHVMEKKNWIY